eukprot:SAG31_NODE_2891_length_4944_cov_2.014035_2_plen_139_part_00
MSDTTPSAVSTKTISPLQEDEPGALAAPAQRGQGPSREQLCNDIVNTGVMAALIGGFALSSLQQDFDMSQGIDVAIYMFSVIGVHACTCSAITSAVLYREANLMPEEQAPAWAASHPILLKMPMVKFGMGCVCCACNC